MSARKYAMRHRLHVPARKKNLTYQSAQWILAHGPRRGHGRKRPAAARMPRAQRVAAPRARGESPDFFEWQNSVFGGAQATRRNPRAKLPMKTWDIFWSPEGRVIATVAAVDAKSAKKKTPLPYRKYMGEVYVEETTRKNPRKRKKARTAAQRAVTRNLVALNRERAGKKRRAPKRSRRTAAKRKGYRSPAQRAATKRMLAANRAWAEETKYARSRSY